MFWDRIRRLFPFLRKTPSQQPYPGVTPEDVERVVQRDFATNVGQAREILRSFSSKWPGKHARVHIACLRLADGDLERLKKMIDVANSDWRDVLLWAHHPEENRRMGPYSKLSRAEEKAITDRDWKQYHDWLNRD